MGASGSMLRKCRRRSALSLCERGEHGLPHAAVEVDPGESRYQVGLWHRVATEKAEEELVGILRRRGLPQRRARAPRRHEVELVEAELLALPDVRLADA